MATNYDEYMQRLESAIATDRMSDSNERVMIPPESDVALRHELITPGIFSELINKNLRIAKLDKFGMFVVRKGCIYITWLESFINSHDLSTDGNMNELNIEVMKDVQTILNVSASKDGWLTEEILMQKKKIGFGLDRHEKRGFLTREKKEE